MFNYKGDFYYLDLQINTQWDLYVNKIYNVNTETQSIFPSYEPAKIVYRVAPEAALDKVFNTISYRADMYDGFEYEPNITFNNFIFQNEYQYNSLIPTELPAHLLNNKKFRT
jgi:hypothetical protein